jgi:hypothetical protein
MKKFLVMIQVFAFASSAASAADDVSSFYSRISGTWEGEVSFLSVDGSKDPIQRYRLSADIKKSQKAGEWKEHYVATLGDGKTITVDIDTQLVGSDTAVFNTIGGAGPVTVKMERVEHSTLTFLQLQSNPENLSEKYLVRNNWILSEDSNTLVVQQTVMDPEGKKVLGDQVNLLTRRQGAGSQ